MWLTLIKRIEGGHFVTRSEAEAVMEELLCGRVETQEIVRLLHALNQRPVQVAELAGFAAVMRRHAAPVFANGEMRPTQMVDTCGTGGDGFDTFNISTAAAIVAARALPERTPITLLITTDEETTKAGAEEIIQHSKLA